MHFVTVEYDGREVMQDASTKQMAYDVATLVSELSS